MIGSSNDETNFPHKLLLTNAQVSKIRKAFANGLSANIKISITKLTEMIQSEGFALYEFTGPLIKGLESMPKYVDNKLKYLLKNREKIFDSIKTVDNSIKGIKSVKKPFRAGMTLTDNNKIKDIIKVIQSLGIRGILLKGLDRGFLLVYSRKRIFKFFRPLMTAGSLLMKSVLTPLTKNVFLPLGLLAGMPAANAAIQKKITILITITILIELQY